jgi:hypothetical protein
MNNEIQWHNRILSAHILQHDPNPCGAVAASIVVDMSLHRSTHCRDANEQQQQQQQ